VLRLASLSAMELRLRRQALQDEPMGFRSFCQQYWPLWVSVHPAPHYASPLSMPSNKSIENCLWTLDWQDTHSAAPTRLRT
jgi:hypothetical protein